VLQAQGLLDEALQEFQAYKEITLQLTQRDPDNNLWQRELSIAHQCMASIFENCALLEESLKEYEAALVIAERLVNHDPTNAKWQEDLQELKSLAESVRQQLMSSSDERSPGFTADN
jgi:tetratricopeptide (TPR) repeat protein